MPSGPAVAIEAARRRPAEAPRWRADFAWLALGLIVLLCWDALGLDLPLVRLFGNAEGFAWRDHWLTAGLLHQGGRWLSIGLFVLTAAGCLRPFGPWRGLVPSERLWWIGITIVCLVLIPQIKRHSATSCPWELQEFGGTARHVSHWLGLWHTVADGGPGRCFPSGHASGAFSFFAIGVALRRSSPRSSRRWLLAIGALGLMFGFGQMARGAHYASHSLYTAWICAALTCASWQALQAWRERGERPVPAVAPSVL